MTKTLTMTNIRDKDIKHLLASRKALVEVLENALAAWPQYDSSSPRHDEEVNGSDMVEWFGWFRDDVVKVLTLAKGA